MAFSVDEMKSSMKSDGFMSAAHYEMVVNPPREVGGGELLRIRAESVSLPGVSFAAVDQYKPFATGRTFQIPHTFTPQEISVTHLVDRKGSIIKTLMDWASFVVDFQGNSSSPYTANYFSEYVVDATILMYANDGSQQKKITLIQMFPSSIDQIQMGWSSVDEIAKLNVSYKFVDYNIS